MRDISLILNQFAFQQTVPRVSLDRGTCAVGRVRRRHTPQGMELIIDDWRLQNGLPSGEGIPPLQDYAVLWNNHDHHAPVERLPELVGAKRSHLVACISLEPDDRTAFPVCIYDQGELSAPSAIRFIGPRLTTLPELPDSPDSPDEEAVRASRTRGALRDIYDRLQQLSVVMVGAGRGAAELSRQLVAAGLRRLTIIDSDRLGTENLDAMPHASTGDVGEPKAVVLARALQQNQPELSLSCISESVLSEPALRFLDQTRADTVFSFVDNDAARLATGWKCRQGQMVHLDIGTLIEHDDGGRRIMRADIRLFEPGRGCIACVPKMPRMEDALYELSAPTGSLRRGQPVPWDQQRSGSLLHLNAYACALAAELWLGYLSGEIRTSHWIRVRWGAGELPRMESASVAPDENCPFCRSGVTN